MFVYYLFGHWLFIFRGKLLIKDNISDFILIGIFMSLGFLTKYLFIYLILAIKIIFLIKIKKDKKFNYYYFIPGIVFFVFITPHFNLVI